MKNQLILLCVLLGFSLNVLAWTGKDQEDEEIASVGEENLDEIKPEKTPERDCNKEPCFLPGSRRTNYISQEVVRAELKEKAKFYFDSRACIFNGKVGVSDACMKASRMCKVDGDLKDADMFPIPTIIVYRKNLGKKATNIVSIKTGEHRYYTGPTVSAPFPNSRTRNFLMAYAPCDLMHK